MSNKPSTSLEKVKKALQLQGFDCHVLELKTSTRTAVEAAQALGCKAEQIVKSLVLKTKRSRRGILVMVSGANRANLKKISAVLSEPIRMADAQFVREKTGFAIGGKTWATMLILSASSSRALRRSSILPFSCPDTTKAEPANKSRLRNRFTASYLGCTPLLSGELTLRI